ncbi:hypothetical protein JOD57_004653 [Geodermatophilus bullaregiensis]|uniref:hypothetical protein n=1 Tax=Geodermatophilus bullaregiensis TaxID=1564160 RepID=UPI00195D4180|nr:hypothetical protein [Geodermatophilus bullaregiensis]MBM7808816.1 hypothetical protein [Geodermatophilus bullaregiensis]
MTESGDDVDGDVAGERDGEATEVERPAEARAWVRARAEAAGCPAAVVDEVVLLVSEVLVADAARSSAAAGPRLLRALPTPDGFVVEVSLPGPLLPLPDRPGDDGTARLAVAAAATTVTVLESRPGDAGGQWVCVAVRT